MDYHQVENSCFHSSRQARSIIMKTILATFWIGQIIFCALGHAGELDLSGSWSFALDRDDVGIQEEWYKQALPDLITFPGSLQEQGYGDTPSDHTEWTSGIGMKLLDDPRFAEYIHGDEFKCPFWLTPDRHYTGAAWYQINVNIPAEWEGQRIVLTLERPHWQSTVWVNDQEAGTRDSLGTPHEYDLTEMMQPTHTERLTIRVDNRYVIPVGKDAHSISDQTQSNWNGITGKIRLISCPKIWFDDVQIYPDVITQKIKVVLHLGNATGNVHRGTLNLYAKSDNTSRTHQTDRRTWPVEIDAQGTEYQLEYDIGPEALFWDAYQPALYQLHLEWKGNDITAVREVVYGMREIGIQDKQFTLNGHKIFLRGTLECCIFPQHGYPPTDVYEWKQILHIAKAYGLNHIRFHSWCPPEAAFIAADEEGFYYQVEASCWASFGEGTPVDAWIYEECDRILNAYGNHPSFLLLSPSNEPGGRNRDAFLGKLLNHLKTDSRRFYTSGSGWPSIPENQYDIQYQTRLQHWPSLQLNQPPQTWDDYREYIEKLSVPTVSHEIGQWCAYPDLGEDVQYTGILKAKNMAIFRDKLQKAGMSDRAHDFLNASGKFQTLLYKQEIETALRTPGMAGFQLLDLHDFPGQGTAPVGVLNALWQSKGYVDEQEYRRFCNDVVPLLRMKKMIFTHEEEWNAAIDVVNYSNKDLENVTIECRIGPDSEPTAIVQTFPNITIPRGGLSHIGEVKPSLKRFPEAIRLRVEVELKGLPYINAWSIWVYPAKVNTDSDSTVQVMQDWQAALDALQNGGNVLLAPNPTDVAGDTLGTFQPIFWNRITFPQQSVHTVGFFCDPSHPALADFPTDFHSNWQWQDLMDHSKPIIMDELPDALHPILQPIDDWNQARKLGLLFEARVGKGKVMICSMDIVHDLDQRITARQLRHSLVAYMSNDRFDPAIRLSRDAYRKLFKESTR